MCALFVHRYSAEWTSSGKGDFTHMFTTLGQYLGGKVITAILVVSGGLTGIYFWKNPDDLATIWKTIQYALVWIGIVLALPWAAFFVTAWVVSKESNAAAAAMLAAYVLVDATVAVWLIGGIGGHSGLTWGVLLLGFLTAGVYNFKVCEYQALRAEDRI